MHHHFSVWSSQLHRDFRDRFETSLQHLERILSATADGSPAAFGKTDLAYATVNRTAHGIALAALECASLCRQSHPDEFLALCGVLKVALHGDLPLELSDLRKLLQLLAGIDPIDPAVFPVDEVLDQIERKIPVGSVPPDWKPLLDRLQQTLQRSLPARTKGTDARRTRIERLGDDSALARLKADEGWGDRLREDLLRIPESDRSGWNQLLCLASQVAPEPPMTEWDVLPDEIQANALDPEAYDAEYARRFFERTASRAWDDAIRQEMAHVGEETFGAARLRWFQTVPDSKPGTLSQFSTNREILRGLLWTCTQSSDSALAQAIRLAARYLFAKNSPLGRTAVRILLAMPAENSLTELTLLAQQVKAENQVRLIEAARLAVAERGGMPTSGLADIPLPTSGFTELGKRIERLAGWTAELGIAETGEIELKWFKPDGTPQKSVPAKLQRDHETDVRGLKGAVQEVKSTLAAARARLESAPMERRSWTLGEWRARYIDHPVAGTAGRRLLWRFEQKDAAVVGGFDGPTVIGQGGKPLRLSDQARVSLWHPLGEPVPEILRWREWLAERDIRQPFKQAYREVYLLTDAERATRTYSNRFASHILRQSQFRALAKSRGWKADYLGQWDGGDRGNCERKLPEWKMRAEFWVAVANTTGDEHGGGLSYVSTDQVRFFDAGSNDPLPLAEVPPIAFSEIMRDVDLFVGVASIGSDPTWSDGGEDRGQRDYWQRFSFGGLSETAATRRDALERIIPRLRIADRCSFADRFLVVRGDLRTYRIHFGSANILMEPNDQYLCIVPARAAAAFDPRFLPFEGDDRLSVILSKALLLADDATISDPSIVSQIAAGRSEAI